MTNDIGETYLHFAAFHSRPDLVKWLIDKGAECNMQVFRPPAHIALGLMMCSAVCVFSCQFVMSELEFGVLAGRQREDGACALCRRRRQHLCALAIAGECRRRSS